MHFDRSNLPRSRSVSPRRDGWTSTYWENRERVLGKRHLTDEIAKLDRRLKALEAADRRRRWRGDAA